MREVRESVKSLFTFSKGTSACRLPWISAMLVKKFGFLLPKESSFFLKDTKIYEGWMM